MDPSRRIQNQTEPWGRDTDNEMWPSFYPDEKQESDINESGRCTVFTAWASRMMIIETKL